ncbi:MAG TPA: metal-dependent hydrolase [Sedimenticola sp.]|nr:metal-dependent hydrolase [Sedimenticola sp.]
MLTPTHLVTGQAVFLLGAIATGHAPTLVEALVVLLASSIPDLDSRHSYVGRMLPFISGPLECRFGHRTLTHSLIAQAIFSAVAYATLPFGYFMALLSGWVSHSLADMMTPAGVCWFWPSRVRCVIPGNRKYRMDSMGQGELTFLVVMALVGLLVKPLAGSGLGTMGLIRSAIGNITSAREDYDAQKGSHAWSLEVKGRDNRSYDDISGSYPVIGPYGEAGFILESPEGPRSLCHSGSCDWYAEHAALIKGQPEITTTTTFRADRVRAGSLFEPLALLQSAGQVYLLGTLSAKRIAPSPPTVEVAGETVTLRYAEALVPAGWGNKLLTDIDLTIQVRHEPGVTVPEIQGLVESEAEGLHPLLWKWIVTTGGAGN